MQSCSLREKSRGTAEPVYDYPMSKIKHFFPASPLATVGVLTSELATFPPLGSIFEFPVRSRLGCGAGCG